MKTIKIDAGDQAVLAYADLVTGLETQLCEHIGADPEAGPLLRKVVLNWDDAGNFESIDVEYVDRANAGAEQPNA